MSGRRGAFADGDLRGASQSARGAFAAALAGNAVAQPDVTARRGARMVLRVVGAEATA